MWLLLCGILFSIALGCLGLCHDGLLICSLVGGLRVGRGVLRCGKWHPLAFFGAYRGKEITGALRMWRSPLEEILSSFYHTLYLSTTAYVFPLSFGFFDFLTRFSS
jgi:hypothetical protein